jgi:hypothetical protein
MKGILNEICPVFRRLDFFRINDDKLYNTQVRLWWDGEVLDVRRNGDEPA